MTSPTVFLRNSKAPAMMLTSSFSRSWYSFVTCLVGRRPRRQTAHHHQTTTTIEKAYPDEFFEAFAVVVLADLLAEDLVEQQRYGQRQREGDQHEELGDPHGAGADGQAEAGAYRLHDTETPRSLVDRDVIAARRPMDAPETRSTPPRAAKRQRRQIKTARTHLRNDLAEDDDAQRRSDDGHDARRQVVEQDRQRRVDEHVAEQQRAQQVIAVVAHLRTHPHTHTRRDVVVIDPKPHRVARPAHAKGFAA